MLKKFVNFYQKQDYIIFWATCAAILLALITIMIWAINYPSLPSQLPLFYSLPWGEKQLATTFQFLILPAIVFLIILVNLIISWHLHTSQLILKRMVTLNSLIVALLVLISAVRIIYTFV